MIENRIGDMFGQPDLNAWIHQANCLCTMGSGVAKTVKEKYPEVWLADQGTNKADIHKLGTFSSAKASDGRVGYNLYGQFNFGKDGALYTNYDAVRTGLLKIQQHITKNISPTAKVGIPFKIGCVRGGGNWNIIKGIIEEIFEKDTIQIVICEFKDYSNTNETFKSALRKAYKKADLMADLDGKSED